jgi:hypothetical protein
VEGARLAALAEHRPGVRAAPMIPVDHALFALLASFLLGLGIGGLAL